MEQNLKYQKLWCRTQNRWNYGAEPRVQGIIDQNIEYKELWSKTQKK